MDGIVGEEADFVGVAEFHGEPVTVDESWGDMLGGESMKCASL